MTDEELGRIVRRVWVEYCIQTGHTERPDRICPWEEMDEWSREVDRRIGVAVAVQVARETAEKCAGLCEIEAGDVASMDEYALTGASEIARQSAKRIRRAYGLNAGD